MSNPMDKSLPSWILPAGIVFLLSVIGGWAIAFFTDQSTKVQSTYSGYGCLAGIALAIVAYFIFGRSKNTNNTPV